MNRAKGNFSGFPTEPQFVALSTDLFAVLAGCALASFVRFGFVDLSERYLFVTMLMALLVLLVNFASGVYGQWLSTGRLQGVLQLTRNWLFVALIITAIMYFAQIALEYSRLWVGFSLVFSLLIAVLVRLAAGVVISRVRASGRNRHNVFLIGPPGTLLEVARRMRQNPGEGFSIGGVSRVVDPLTDTEIVNLVARIADSGAREVWICMPMEMGSTVKGLMYALRNETAEVRFFPRFSDSLLLNHRVSHVLGMYSVDLSVTPFNGPALLLKRLEDLLIGSVIAVLIAPVCVLIAVAIKVTSPGPVLFKQYRMGINGKRFKVYKFRSMKIHQEEGGVITQACKNDSRVTRVGAFLRRTSLDELPQFYNVLQGRMSIVGPRPHALSHNEYYKDLVESYMRRHKVKPGITGWAQVNGLRGETDTLDKMRRRVEHDLWYIDNWSLGLDLRIIFLTIVKGFINKNAY